MEVLISCAGKLVCVFERVPSFSNSAILICYTYRPDFDSPSLFGRLLDKDKGRLLGAGFPFRGDDVVTEY